MKLQSQMKLVAVILLHILPLLGLSQDRNIIRGKVVNGETGMAIPNASVFISNTSKGTITSATGAFELQNIPGGSYDLIISSIGFNTQVFAFSQAKLPLTLEVRLEPKADELNAITIEPDEKDGWAKWGSFFIEHFIGTTEASENCVLKNKESLRFKFSKKKNILSISSDAPLVIENKALGYLVKYQLEEFSFDFNSRALLFMGYPLFTDLSEGRKKIPQRWLTNRARAYSGSIMHFMRSLYLNSLQENGFEVRRLTKIPNLEKQRVREIFRSLSRRPSDSTNSTIVAMQSSDSSGYYDRILKQPDMFDEFGTKLLISDSLLTNHSESQRTLYFPNYLYITFKKELEERKYVESLWEKRKPFFQRSTVHLVDATPVVIENNGNYLPPEVFFASGYWAWSEKISHLLPYDYDPPGELD